MPLEPSLLFLLQQSTNFYQAFAINPVYKTVAKIRYLISVTRCLPPTDNKYMEPIDSDILCLLQITKQGTHGLKCFWGKRIGHSWRNRGIFHPIKFVLRNQILFASMFWACQRLSWLLNDWLKGECMKAVFNNALPLLFAIESVHDKYRDGWQGKTIFAIYQFLLLARLEQVARFLSTSILANCTRCKIFAKRIQTPLEQL